MFNITNNPFKQPSPEIPDDVQIVFVSDMFVEDYPGGAELTTEALIKKSPFKVFKLHSKDVTLELLKQGHSRFWIFGNFAMMDLNLIPTIVGNMRYSVVEYDYKYCRYRSPEKHLMIDKVPCDCHNQTHGKMISAFYYGAMGLWWMSEKQKDKYHTMFPFLAEKDNVVLSSVFDDETFVNVKRLREKYKDTERKGWIAIGSDSWVKGAEASERWCKENEKEYETVWNLPYDQVLEKLAQAEGFVCLPEGGDTCPRMVIEAKLLGCKLQLNDNVQHKDEEWFATDDLSLTEEYLYANRKLFWSGIKAMMEYNPTISGYTTTYNSVSQGYPLEECVKSMLEFCDEVCICDGGSTDETWQKIQSLANMDDRIKTKQIPRDWDSPRFAVFDGMQKAEARKMCTMEFCWQMDSDEIVHEKDAQKIKELCRAMPHDCDIMTLPVVEYWGGPDKVRIDVMPWKWRLSRNKPHITHGIPKELIRKDDNGEVYAAEGTDGCDMIHAETNERLLHLAFYNPQVDNVRKAAMNGNEDALKAYEEWLNSAVDQLPGVFHYSWYDIARKIRLYRDYWTKHWNALYGKNTDDTAENNMMFDIPWSEVTDEMIEERAKEFKEKMGGWIWHRKWDGRETPHVKIVTPEPAIMRRDK